MSGAARVDPVSCPYKKYDEAMAAADSHAAFCGVRPAGYEACPQQVRLDNAERVALVEAEICSYNAPERVAMRAVVKAARKNWRS